MKIAIISFYSSYLNRGAENWAYELSKRLAKYHKVIIYSGADVNLTVDWTKLDSPGGIKRLFFIDYQSLVIAKFTFKILPSLWKENFDIIIPINGGWQPRLIRILTWLKRSKMLIVGHSGRGWDDRNNLWTFPDIFVALTEAAQVWARRINPFIKIEHVPNGVDLNQFSPQGSKISIKLKKPIILCVGALIESKQIDLTIKAVALMKNVSLLVVGKGIMERKLSNLGTKLLGNKFHMTYYPYHKMQEVYRVADVFTLSSWANEAFPLAYLEAMASGLPVVATDDEIRTEIVGEAGILVNPQNSQAYAKAISNALINDWEDKPRKQAEKFSWDKIAKRYQEVMENL